MHQAEGRKMANSSICFVFFFLLYHTDKREQQQKRDRDGMGEVYSNVSTNSMGVQ